jgi:acetyl-CoA acetyltransferase
MEHTVVVGAVRTPLGRRAKGLSGLHPARLLGMVQREVLARAGVDPGLVGHVIGGCVAQGDGRGQYGWRLLSVRRTTQPSEETST